MRKLKSLLPSTFKRNLEKVVFPLSIILVFAFIVFGARFVLGPPKHKVSVSENQNKTELAHNGKNKNDEKKTRSQPKKKKNKNNETAKEKPNKQNQTQRKTDFSLKKIEDEKIRSIGKEYGLEPTVERKETKAEKPKIQKPKREPEEMLYSRITTKNKKDGSLKVYWDKNIIVVNGQILKGEPVR
jgi:exopolysaccharide biosynthesis protein